MTFLTFLCWNSVLLKWATHKRGLMLHNTADQKNACWPAMATPPPPHWFHPQYAAVERRCQIHALQGWDCHRLQIIWKHQTQQDYILCISVQAFKMNDTICNDVKMCDWYRCVNHYSKVWNNYDLHFFRKKSLMLFNKEFWNKVSKFSQY